MKETDRVTECVRGCDEVSLLPEESRRREGEVNRPPFDPSPPLKPSKDMDDFTEMLAMSSTSPNSTSELRIIASFAGPNLLGSLVQGFETGIIFGQALRFWSSSQRESMIVKACVVYAVAVVTLQTSFSVEIDL